MSSVATMGCDPHLDMFTASVVDAVGQQVTVKEFRNAPGGWADAVRMARRYGISTVGVEAASGYGRRLSQALVGVGLEVIEVPTRLTAGHRKREGRGKTDAGDARAVARAVAGGEGSVWNDEPGLEALRVVTHRRDALVGTQTADINQLRALLVEVDPQRAGHTGRLRSVSGLRALSRVGYSGDVHRRTVAGLIRDLARECRSRLERINELTAQIRQLMPPIGWRLIDEIKGMGVITAAILLSEIAGTDGFATDAKFAAFAGVAPLEASSGRRKRHRLNRGGNRQANRALHLIVISQLRHRGEATAFVDKHLKWNKTKREAIRALKRHIARSIWKLLHKPT